MRRENGERNKRFLFQHRLTLSLFCYARYILDGYFLNVFLCVCVCVVAVLLSHVFLSYVVYFIHVYHINYHQGFRNAMLLNLLARFIF